MYRLLTWDHERSGWVLEAQASNLWRLREELRFLRDFWGDASLLVVGPAGHDFVEVPREDEAAEAEPQQGLLF